MRISTNDLCDVLRSMKITVNGLSTANELLLLPLLVSIGNFLKRTARHHSMPLILHAILVLLLLNILPSPIRSHHFLTPAILISVNSAAVHTSLS